MAQPDFKKNKTQLGECQKLTRDLRETGTIGGIRYKRRIARPDVRVVIVVAPLDVGVAGRNDSAVAVAMRANRQDRSAIQLDDLLRQIAKVLTLTPDAGLPRRNDARRRVG